MLLKSSHCAHAHILLCFYNRERDRCEYIRCVAIQGTKERNQRVREEYKVD